MDFITYEIDPGGDTELVLNKPNEQDIIPSLQLSTDILDTDLHGPKFENSPCRGRYKILNKLYAKGTPSDCKIRIRVSSRHLILASRTFRVMLEGPWKKATSSQSLRQINATGWDALAFVIVLDAIHGRHRGIPDEPTLGLVTRIATIIDYYECHDALYVYFDKWLNHNPLVNTAINTLRKKALLCLYIAWVFSDQTIFIRMARVVFRHSEGLSQIETSDVPLGGVLELIEEERRGFLGYLFDNLDAVQVALLDETECPEGHGSGCASQTLGGLMRARHKLADPENPPEYPYEGYSIAAVLTMIEVIEKAMPLDPSRPPASMCTVAGRMHAAVRNVETNIVYFARKE